MNYQTLDQIVKTKALAIDLDYSIGHLENLFVHTNKSPEDLEKLFAQDLALFAEIEKLSLKREAPKEGDFVANTLRPKPQPNP